MTHWQEVAIKNHCRFGFETAQRKFCHIHSDGKVTVVLSVNSGYE